MDAPLTAAGVPQSVERASQLLPRRGADARREMKLQAALGASLNFTGGTVREILIVWTSALDLAERVGDVDYQLRALFGLWTHRDATGSRIRPEFAALAVTPAIGSS